MPNSNSLPPLTLLMAFEAAARLHSFTAAAQELGSTQSAISQHVKRLEVEIGSPLFQRTHRGVQLTRAGDQLYTPVAQGLTQLLKGVQQTRKQAHHDVINVATDYALGSYWILPRLRHFRTRHPNVDVRLVTSQQSVTPDQADVDIALLFGNGHDISAPTRPLFTEQVIPVCSPALLERYPAGSGSARLTELPLLQLEADHNARWFDWPELFSRLNIGSAPREPELMFNNYTLLLQAALSGQGVAIGWSPFIEPMLDSGALVALTETPLQSLNGYHIVFPTNRAVAPLVLEFVDWLVEEGRETMAGR
ncbi:choline sulfate utilization transcriptional regulator [Saccharospirillum alexandrii]|uniref:choline sulfate utilization transcriptional regulator n=1 Tax=Saccharospirillum alexandrii TaxID=2448477 RepID=UPI001C70A2A5|nr:LysR substrate-binding domain-containing protein [Saccharospirillum alexandrii]